MAINPKAQPTQVIIKGKTLDGKEVPILVESDGTVHILGNVNVGNFPKDYPDSAVLAKLDNPSDPQTVQLLSGGSEIDPRIISDVEKVADVRKYLAPTSLGAGGTATIWTPAVGKKARPKLVSVTVDSKTRIELRWETTAFESHFLPADGNIIFNLIGSNDEGAVDESLTILVSEPATVSVTARGDEV